MTVWQVRKEGSPDVLSLPTAAEVLTGLRDGNFLPTDEVKGPTDVVWIAIEAHPTFAEAAEDIDPPPDEADDTHLDMNPLIDVCLVLLIFFILTITYASLERALDVPEDTADDKGAPERHKDEFKDDSFMVLVKMDGERPIIKMGTQGTLKEVPQERIFADMGNIINTTARKQMLLDIDKDVPWGIETAILDAAKGNKVHRIINNQRTRK